MPKSYKLTYFNGKGRAEPSRYMFAIARVEYEDKRVTGDEWKELKPKLTLGQLPTLEVDGTILAQSHAIHRFVGSELGFYGPSAWDRAQVDVILDTAAEVKPYVTNIFEEKDETKKAELKKVFEVEHVKNSLEKLEKLLKLNHGGNGWFVGEKLTLADVMVFSMYYEFIPLVCNKKSGELDLSKCGSLKGLLERFKAHPKVAEWIKTRPESTM